MALGQSEAGKKSSLENITNLDDSGFAEGLGNVRIHEKFIALINSSSKSIQCYSSSSVSYDNLNHKAGYQQHQPSPPASPSRRPHWHSPWHHPVPQPAAQDTHPYSRTYRRSRNHWGRRISVWGSQSHYRRWLYPDNAQVTYSWNSTLNIVLNRVGESVGPVVFLQHGLLCSSVDWVLGARDKALGMRQSNQCFDKHALTKDSYLRTLAMMCGWETSGATLTAESTMSLTRTEKSSGVSLSTRWGRGICPRCSTMCWSSLARRSSHTLDTRWAPWPSGSWWIVGPGWMLRWGQLIKMKKKASDFSQVRLMVGLAPVTAPALHRNSPLHPLATHSQRVSTNTDVTLSNIFWPAVRTAQYYGQLWVSGKRLCDHRPEAEHLGQGGRLRAGQGDAGEQLGDRRRADSRHPEHPLWYGWSSSGNTGILFIYYVIQFGGLGRRPPPGM